VSPLQLNNEPTHVGCHDKEFMGEKPKSIWKKSWRGTGSLSLAWLGLMIAAWIIFAVITLATGARITSEELKLWAALSLCATVIIFSVLLIRWLFCWRNLKRTFFVFACLATLIALFYAEEDWRGKHDWEKFKREWEAKGEKFDFKDFVPPPVPDDQNFAMAPIWVESIKATLGPKNSLKLFGNYAENGRTNFTDRLALNIYRNNDWNGGTNGYWARETMTDLKSWQNYYRAVQTNRNSTIATNEFSVAPQPQTPAQDVLLALSKYDPAIEELRQASELPYSRFPLNYDDEDPWEVLLPHLAALKRISQVLQLRAIAELQNNESKKAAADVKLSFHMIESIRSEPFLISDLVRIAICDITLQPIYEGLAERRWSDEQLVALDAELAKLNFLSDYQLSMRGERAMTCATIDYISKKQSYQRYQALMGEVQNNESVTFSGPLKNTAKAVGIYLMPAGWFEQNKLFIAQGEQGWMTGWVFPEEHLVSPQKFRQVGSAQDKIYSRPVKPWNFLAKEFFPALGAAGRKASREQLSVDLARTAIALERFRIAHGNFPESLDALEPQLVAQVSHDVIGGQPLHYRRTDDGQFVLYSVGWNEKDDGGITGHRNGGSAPDFDSGDWVWRYPQK
jgi:hypothetical protein